MFSGRLSRALNFTTVLFGVLIAASSANAQRVDIQERVVGYEVTGKTATKLVEDMRRKGPRSAFGGPNYFAQADTQYKWYVYPRKTEEGCEIESYEVYLDITYTIPTWVDRERAGKRLRRYWDAYIAKLWIHEEGHGDIALEIAKEISKVISTPRTGPDCETLVEDALNRGKNFLDASTAQRDYDRETKHGATQGAIFDVNDARRGRI